MTEAETLPTALIVEPSTVLELRDRGLAELLEQHTRELEPAMINRLEPSWDLYHAAQVNGQLIVVAAWGRALGEPALKLVGYAVAAVCNSLHYRDHVFVQVDVLFVAHEWRARGVGQRLIRELRVEARRLGAELLIMHAKLGSPMESLLDRIAGFTREEVVFTEAL